MAEGEMLAARRGERAARLGPKTPKCHRPSWAALQDVLSSCRSKQQLASALKEVADKGEKLELDAVGLQGLVKELLQVGIAMAVSLSPTAGILMFITADAGQRRRQLDKHCKWGWHHSCSIAVGRDC